MPPTITVPANQHHNGRALYLLADIGGTNARFAFVEPDKPLPQPIANYAVEDFPSFDGVLDQLEADWLELQQQKERSTTLGPSLCGACSAGIGRSS